MLPENFALANTKNNEAFEFSLLVAVSGPQIIKTENTKAGNNTWLLILISTNVLLFIKLHKTTSELQKSRKKC